MFATFCFLLQSHHSLLITKQLTEIGGYATRLFSHYRPFNLAAFIASFSMIVMVSPFAISVSALCLLQFQLNEWASAD